MFKDKQKKSLSKIFEVSDKNWSELNDIKLIHGKEIQQEDKLQVT